MLHIKIYTSIPYTENLLKKALNSFIIDFKIKNKGIYFFTILKSKNEEEIEL